MIWHLNLSIRDCHSVQTELQAHTRHILYVVHLLLFRPKDFYLSICADEQHLV